MIIERKGVITREELEEALNKLRASKPYKTLRMHFGKLKRGIDSLAYQKKVRG
jgi:hypothetical protein